MSNRIIRSSGALFAPSMSTQPEVTEVPGFPGNFVSSNTSTSGIVDGNTLTPIRIRYDGPANTCHPNYVETCVLYDGSLPDPTRPTRHEPAIYHGKPFSLIRRPKACIVYYPRVSAIPFSETDFLNAMDNVVNDAWELGVHVYCSPSPLTANWLLWGMPMGGYQAGAYGDWNSRASLPSSFPYGELLVCQFTDDPAGWGSNPNSGLTISAWDSGTQTLLTQSLAAQTAGTLLAGSYYGFEAAAAIDSPTMIADDLAIAAEYITHFDRFRQIMHKYDDAAITKGYQSLVTPQPTPPAGYPGDAIDVFNAVAGSLPEFVVGADINPLGSYDDMALQILADIEDFFS